MVHFPLCEHGYHTLVQTKRTILKSLKRLGFALVFFFLHQQLIKYCVQCMMHIAYLVTIVGGDVGQSLGLNLNHLVSKCTKTERNSRNPLI